MKKDLAIIDWKKRMISDSGTDWRLIRDLGEGVEFRYVIESSTKKPQNRTVDLCGRDPTGKRFVKNIIEAPAVETPTDGNLRLRLFSMIEEQGGLVKHIDKVVSRQGRTRRDNHAQVLSMVVELREYVENRFIDVAKTQEKITQTLIEALERLQQYENEEFDLIDVGGGGITYTRRPVHTVTADYMRQAVEHRNKSVNEIGREVSDERLI